MLDQIQNTDRLDSSPFSPFRAAYLSDDVRAAAERGSDGEALFGDTRTDVVEVAVYDDVEAAPLRVDEVRRYRVSRSGTLLLPLYDVLADADLSEGGEYTVKMSFLRKVVWPGGALGDITPDGEDGLRALRRNLGTRVGYKMRVGEISRSRTEVRLRPMRVGAERFDDAFREAFVGFFDEGVRPMRYALNTGDGALHPVLNCVVDRESSPEFPHSAVLKLQQPLPQRVKEGAETWLSEQVFSPVIDRISVPASPADDEDLVYLRSPDFDTEINRRQFSQTGRRSWEQLLDGGSVESTEQVLSRLLEQRDRIDLNVDYTTLSEFVRFSSAEERVRNFIYKYEMLADLNEDVERLSVQTDPVSAEEEERKRRRRANLVEGLTAYERHLYSSDALRDSTGDLRSPQHPAVRQWAEERLRQAARYDVTNGDSLRASLPEYIRADDRNEDFITFVDMMGEYFDELWLYIKHFSYTSDRAELIDDPESLSRELTRFVSDSFGFPLTSGFDLQDLYTYAFTDADAELPFADTPGTQAEAGEVVQQQTWRRVLNAVPGIAKTKGTNRGLRALLAAYGIPRIGLTIREYGGGSDTDTPGFHRIEDITQALSFAQDGQVDIDWPSQRVETLTMRFRTEYRGAQTLELMRVDGVFTLELRPVPGKDDRVRALVLSPAYGADVEIERDIPLADGGWAHAAVTRSGDSLRLQVGKLGEAGPYEFGDTTASTDGLTWSAVVTDDAAQALQTAWDGNMSPAVVGDGLLGDVDFIRVWRTALAPSRAIDHALAPSRYDFDNTDFARSADFDEYDEALNRELLVRIAFTEPADLSGGALLENEAFETLYTGQATASGFAAVAEEPWQFVRVRRTSFVDPVKIGALTLTDDKIRFADTSLTGNLSPSEKREIGDPDQRRSDSNRLGVFFDPQSGVNEDIVSSLGISDINSLLARPDERFDERYAALDRLNTKYWRKYDRPVDTEAFVRYVEQFNRAFFMQIEDLVPARVNLKRGLVIEPSLLERYRFKQLGVNREDQAETTSLGVLSNVGAGADPALYRASFDVAARVVGSGGDAYIGDDEPGAALEPDRRFFGDYLSSNNFRTRQAPDLYPEGEYWEQEPIAGTQVGIRNPDSYARERRIPKSPIRITRIEPIWDRYNIFHTYFFQSYGTFTVYADGQTSEQPPNVATYDESAYSTQTGAQRIRSPIGLIQPPERPYARYRHYIYNREFRTAKRNQLYDGMVYDSSVEGKPAVEITQTTPERLITSPADREEGRGPILDVE